MTATDDRPRSWADACRRIDTLTRWHRDAMEAVEGMRVSRDHARMECRHTAEALKLSHEVREETAQLLADATDEIERLRDELSDECERLSAALDALREENDGLRCELDEARGQA